MHSPQRQRTRRRIREQDNRGRDPEGPGRDLQKEDTRDSRRLSGEVTRGDQTDVRRYDVGDGEDGQGDAVAAQGAEPGLKGGVDEELDEDSEDAEGGEEDADCWGGETEAAVEFDGRVGGR